MNEKSKKINILHLRDSPWLDGPGRTILETASSIDSSHYGYIIGAFRSKACTDHTFITAAEERHLHIFQIIESGPFDPNVISQTLKLIDEQQIHILHTHEVRSDLIGLLCAKVKRIPVVATIHGWITNEIKGQIYTRADKCILQFFDHIIAVSEKIKEQVLRLSISEKKISVLHNALVLENFQRDPYDREFRKEVGAIKGSFLIGNIGRLSPEKGQAKFILAAREILQHYSNVKFVLIGTGPDLKKLQQLVKELQIEQSVIFTGYRTDMLKIYNSLDLVVQSSYTEGMPNVVLESLLMEVPVIATDVGGTPEAIINEKTGILIVPKNTEEIKRQIILFLKNQNKFRMMAVRGRHLVKEKFNFYDRTKKLSNIYDTLIKK